MNIPTDFQATTYSIGPFTIDSEKKQVTFTPGVYVVRKPLQLSFDKATVFDGIEYKPLNDERPTSRLDHDPSDG